MQSFQSALLQIFKTEFDISQILPILVQLALQETTHILRLPQATGCKVDMETFSVLHFELVNSHE